MRIFSAANAVGYLALVFSLLAVPMVVSGDLTEATAYVPASASPPASRSGSDDLQSQVRTSVAGVINLAADGFQDLTVSCPSGTVALGGGVDVGDVASMTIFGTGPTVSGARLNATADGTYGAPDGWFGGVHNGDSIGRPFKVGAVCVQLTGITTVVTSQNVNPSAWWFNKVICPAGTVAVGGGVDVQDDTQMIVTSSGPTIAGSRPLDTPDGSYGAPDGWGGTVRNDSDSVKTFKVGVVCQPLKGITTVISSDTAAAGSSETHAIGCPVSSIAVGGGLDAANVYSVLATQTAPRFEVPQATLMQRDPGVQPAPVGWQASVSNTTAAPQDLKVAAICARWPLVYFTGDEEPPPER